MIAFTVPADFQINTVEKMRKLEMAYPENQIREVFGNISGSKWPSGHGYLKSQKYASSLEALKEYIDALKAYGYDYNYTFNASCLDNQDIKENSQKEILNYIEELMNIGVNRITVASPALIEAIHARFPKMMITASAILGIDSVIRANGIANLGASTIVLHEDLTRDFARIKSMSENCPADMEIIVNSKCTFNCLYRNAHYNSVSHDMVGEKAVYSYGRNCARNRKENPVEYIKSLWIRPEDLEVYSEYGIKLFKLIGRERLSDIDLLRMIEIYFSRNFEGNLLDLIFGFSNTQKHLYVDNKKLDGFLDKFVKGPFDCLEKCTESQCNYCKTYLDRALVKTQEGEVS